MVSHLYRRAGAEVGKLKKKVEKQREKEKKQGERDRGIRYKAFSNSL